MTLSITICLFYYPLSALCLCLSLTPMFALIFPPISMHLFLLLPALHSKCLNHQWQCTQRNCPSTCSAFGESHYTTYDGREFEFQGACDYVLSQSIHGGPHKFVITARNSQCGTSGVTCFKQLEFTVGTQGTSDFYRLELIKGNSYVCGSTRITGVSILVKFARVCPPN